MIYLTKNLHLEEIFYKKMDKCFTKEDIQMPSKHMKRCSLPLAIWEMLIKTTVSCYYTSIGMAKIKWYYQMLTSMWRIWITPTLVVGMENGTAALENSLAVSYTTKPALTIWPSHRTLVFIPEKWRLMFPQKTWTWMFIAASFVVDKNWKQIKCSSADGWLNKQW